MVVCVLYAYNLTWNHEIQNSPIYRTIINRYHTRKVQNGDTFVVLFKPTKSKIFTARKRSCGKVSSLSKGSLSRGSLSGVLCPGRRGSVQESLSEGLCQGVFVTETPLMVEEWAVRILLECILVFDENEPVVSRMLIGKNLNVKT